MNQYVKIPRGIYVNNTNDIIFETIIKELGKKHSGNFVTSKLSNYARGKIYLRNKYGISGTALKRIHKVKTSTTGMSIGLNYSNYISIHRYNASQIVEDIINELENDKKISVEEISEEFFNDNNVLQKTYINAFMYNTLEWIEDARCDANNFCKFNKCETALVEAIRIKTDLLNVDKKF